MQTMTIAIVADDTSIRQNMCGALNNGVYAILELDSAMLDKQGILGDAHAVCLHASGSLVVLERLRTSDPDLPVVVVGSRDLAKAALDAGAYDVVEEPLDSVSLRRVIDHAVERRQLTNQVNELRSELTTRTGDDGDVVIPLRELERQAIARALRATKGSVTKAAKLLGIGRATLYRRLASPEMASLRPRRGYETSPRSMASVGHSAMTAAAGDPR